MPTCPEFWVDSPKVLVTGWKEFFPFTERDMRCTAAGLNSFTRVGIYIGILLAILRRDPTWLLVGVFFAAFAYGAWTYMGTTGAIREGFAAKEDENGEGEEKGEGEGFSSYRDTYAPVETTAPVTDAATLNGQYVPDVIGLQGRTNPSAANPFMNVLISEISSDPKRSPAASVREPRVQSELDTYFDTMFYADPGDAFGHTQSQRQFVTMPSTTIPNDQGSYQDWLYRTPGQSCKEGNLAACNFDTGDAAIPWREMRRST
jgi:hypothetical protein